MSLFTALRTWPWSIRTTTTPSGSVAGRSCVRTVPGARRYGRRGARHLGSARGRKLVAPAGSATRPTPDRVREATFNALGSLGVVAEAAVLDLFAGSGAMGIEALSRGAARGDLRRPRPRTRGGPSRPTWRRVGCRTRPRWWRAPSERFLAGAQQRRWDLALLDPPYDYDGWPELLLDLPAEMAVLESSRRDRSALRLGGACGPSATGARTSSSPSASSSDGAWW